jgi:hypothetical protein
VKATKMIRLFVLTTALLCLGSSQRLGAQQRPSPVRSYVRDGYVPSASDSGGLREVIDNRYKKRYEEWKAEFLSTDIGRAQW